MRVYNLCLSDLWLITIYEGEFHFETYGHSKRGKDITRD